MEKFIEIFWTKMYDIYWENGDFENDIKNYDISSFNLVDVIIYLFNNKCDQGFILSALKWKTDLWSLLSKQDWMKIIENIKRNVGARYLIGNYGMYCDIVFLYRYLKIDGLKLLMETNIYKETKNNILQDIQKISFELEYSILDEENFEDGTFPNKELYPLIHNKLIKQACKKAKLDLANINKDILKFIENL
ncbi:hypothetical protein [Chryseobacterium luteum]|uniref:Uncharacterized protein n=1 Tax=Chryseobacterium luteum TaxID=421531 RepID=A0A085ZBB1_9FLAO|nr:hypothetical protein [Chryseobacterium luteum]KFF01725.1 hypothetical protein IX38_16795 [Chryseobacterium luteum]